MSQMQSLGLILAAIFGLLALGAFFSPTYTQQMGYAQGFLFAGGLLFITSVVILVAALGFRTFALYLAVLLSMTIAAFGIYGGLLVIILTYMSWGVVFALQLLLAHHQVPTAIDWFVAHYTYRTFRTEYWIFYPMLWIFYLFLDVIPSWIAREHLIRFDPRKILNAMARILPPE